MNDVIPTPPKRDGRFIVRHGQSGQRTTPEYAAWRSMRSRCNQPACNGYQRYGGRGIRVCERWESFESFLIDMGPCPEGAQLDRKDNERGYEPDNCRWATREEQARNRRSNTLLSAHGKTQCLAAWAEEYGINRYTLSSRLLRGWSLERALGASVKP